MTKNILNYYANSKEKLTKLKSEISEIDEENQIKQSEINQLLQSIDEMNCRLELLNQENKTVKSDLFSLSKKKEELKKQKAELIFEINEKEKQIETEKSVLSNKIKVIKGDVLNVNLNKERNLSVVLNMIDEETSKEEKNNIMIHDLNEEIKIYKGLIKEMKNEDKQNQNLILQENESMRKFLSEI